jgi:hypothetical protein
LRIVGEGARSNTAYVAVLTHLIVSMYLRMQHVVVVRDILAYAQVLEVAAVSTDGAAVQTHIVEKDVKKDLVDVIRQGFASSSCITVYKI